MPDLTSENDLKPLEVATKTYYWKPFAALFRSLEIRIYRRSNIVFEEPVLDLGCGDGKAAQMLGEFEITKPPLCGLDYSHREIRKALDTGFHLNLFQGDARNLPFQDSSFSTVVCNGLLICIPDGPESALKEISRVLKKNGVLVATVPTDQFVDILILPKLFRKISSFWASSYIKRLNNRLPHFHVYSKEVWRRLFKESQLEVIEASPFFSSRSGFVWNILTIQVFRLFGVLKLIKSKRVTSFSSYLLKSFLKKTYVLEQTQSSENGYLYMVASNKKDLFS